MEKGIAGKGVNFTISIVVALVVTLITHYQDGYPWLNCILVGLATGFLCLVVLTVRK
ncbi:MAG: hypothetical protein WCW61_04970 [Patescibacteria group bacterium]|jgi:xanthine/uracil permease